MVQFYFLDSESVFQLFLMKVPNNKYILAYNDFNCRLA